MLALLLDVDGPVASPVTRDVQPGIIADLVALAAAGIPVIFNTGRSDAFIREQVMEPMIAAGMPAGTLIHAICEKGAVWFSYTADGPGPVHVDQELAIPQAYGDDVRRLVAEDYAAHMFFDETKRAMVSVEQHVAVANADYLRRAGTLRRRRHGADGAATASASCGWTTTHPNSDDADRLPRGPHHHLHGHRVRPAGQGPGREPRRGAAGGPGHHAAGLADGGRFPHRLRHGRLAAPQRPRR